MSIKLDDVGDNASIAAHKVVLDRLFEEDDDVSQSVMEHSIAAVEFLGDEEGVGCSECKVVVGDDDSVCGCLGGDC